MHNRIKPRKIRLVEGNAKCRHLKKFTFKGAQCEIFDRSDFHYFYTIKPFWVDDFVVKILTYYFNFWGSQASFSF